MMTNLLTVGVLTAALLQPVNNVEVEVGKSFLTDLDKVAAEVNLAQEYYIPGIELSKDLQRHAYLLSQKYNVEYKIIISIMWVESKFQVDALNTANSNGSYDIGLMQINSSNIDWVNELAGRELHLFDPYDNIEAGILIYSIYKNYWDSRIENNLLQRYSLITYNRGLGGFRKINYETHIDYDNKVMSYREELN